MLFARSLLVLTVAVAGLFVPAQAQMQNRLFLNVPVTNASGYKIAYMLDPQHNNAPEEDFALWPGLPAQADLKPQAARLFVAAGNSNYQLPNGVLAVTAMEGNEDKGVTIWYPFVPNVNMAPTSPIGRVLSMIKWFDQPNDSASVYAKLWRFTDDIPEPFAKMMENWDGKSPIIEQVDPEDMQNITLTGNYVKDTDTAKYKLKSGFPLDMEFHSNIAARRKDPALPKDHVRVTVARFLRDGGMGMEPDADLTVLFDSPGNLWDPIAVPEFSPSKDIVVLLPEEPDRDEVKATFLQFHLTPAAG
ncbi:hypothetical protein EON83_19130 [bacterium]|nr:MAG: hypothetical protein EON83_19130 [bacterium]